MKEILSSSKKNKVMLPDVQNTTLPAIKEIIESVSVVGNVVADDEEIEYAWLNLPRELSKIPIELRDELLARMCIAISVGLFDGAINYIWNASIKNLRIKVKEFGISIISKMLDKDFDEKKLLDLKDAELLSLCLKLNLISEDGYYFLNQNRDMRNNFSVAHPSSSLIDDRELMTFISRCAKYALANDNSVVGIDINDFTKTIKSGLFNETQYSVWKERILNTNQTQQDFILIMLYGIYCDPSSGQEARMNSINISKDLKEKFSSNFISDLLNKHYEYQAKGKEEKFKASQVYFKDLGMLGYLSDLERHNIISTACDKLESVHLAYHNFYTEPPFAERLLELVCDTDVPETTKVKYVTTVVMCYIGNRYGSSEMALEFYEKMIKDFTPMENDILLRLSQSKNIISDRIKNWARCKEMYNKALGLINKDVLTPSQIPIYEAILSK